MSTRTTTMSYKTIFHSVFEEIGFKNGADFLQAIFYFKFPLFGMLLATMLTMMQEFINNYIYTPAEGIMILVGVTFIDVILGIAKAVKTKDGVHGSRLMRAFIRLVIQIAFVGLFFQMSLIWSAMIMGWMVDALLILFTLSTFWSGIKNAKELGLLTEDQYSVLESVIGLKKIFSKFTKGGNKS